ncbi:MAG: hypothetical protein ABFS34_07065 [Gemmatimonadota bacterium]
MTGIGQTQPSREVPIVSRRWRLSIVSSLVFYVVLAIVARALERADSGYARSVAQSAADAAALAGASSFLDAHDDERLARQSATDYVRSNETGRVMLAPEDILIDLKEGMIQVRVEARVSSLPAPLAWLAGVRPSVVTATAAAEAQMPQCVDTGLNPEGFETVRCEGMIKVLRLIPPQDTTAETPAQ